MGSGQGSPMQGDVSLRVSDQRIGSMLQEETEKTNFTDGFFRLASRGNRLTQ